jgi:hypothetical protein
MVTQRSTALPVRPSGQAPPLTYAATVEELTKRYWERHRKPPDERARRAIALAARELQEDRGQPWRRGSSSVLS